MAMHHFLSSTVAEPPIAPPERWLLAFPQGQWSNWTHLQAHSGPGDVVWVPVSHKDWMDKVSALAQAEPQRYVVVLSPLPYDAEGLRAINAGARGYCHLHAVPELLREVGQAVQGGALWVGPELVERIVAATRELLGRAGPAATAALPPVDLSVLSAREMEVARVVAAGKSNKEVAAQLHISERTVKAHLGAIFEKLGVRDRVQLVLRLSSVDSPSRS
jgi:DNA-binding NarL/FixJ family response regulator